VLRGSSDYLASVLGMLEDVRDRCPALAGACCGNDHRARWVTSTVTSSCTRRRVWDSTSTRRRWRNTRSRRRSR